MHEHDVHVIQGMAFTEWNPPLALPLIQADSLYVKYMCGSSR